MKGIALPRLFSLTILILKVKNPGITFCSDSKEQKGSEAISKCGHAHERAGKELICSHFLPLTSYGYQ
jgi:hypothetical protein